MARRVRTIVGGYVYHLLNRAVGRMTLFHEVGDYAAFARTLAEAHDQQPLRLLAYCLMPNHFHLVVWPEEDGHALVSRFMQWLTATHAQRWHLHRGNVGTGPIYQGRYKAFPVSTDRYFYTLMRYVERNALRANLVTRAEQWRWSSLHQREIGDHRSPVPLADWPLPPPANWAALVNEALTPDELAAVRRSVKRGRPLGEPHWTRQTAERLGLNHTLRRPGRPARGAPVPEEPLDATC